MRDIYTKAYEAVIYEDIESPKGLDDFIASYDAKEADRTDIIELLKVAVVDEWLAAYNYYASEAHTKTEGKADFDPEFRAHAHEELSHFEKLNMRLRELSQEPLQIPMQMFMTKNSSQDSWQQEMNSDNSIEILSRRLEEERGAIKFYDLVLRTIQKLRDATGEYDSTTEMLVKQIKAEEEEHERDLHELLHEHSTETSLVKA